jgi:hypothetical protein
MYIMYISGIPYRYIMNERIIAANVPQASIDAYAVWARPRRWSGSGLKKTTEHSATDTWTVLESRVNNVVHRPCVHMSPYQRRRVRILLASIRHFLNATTLIDHVRSSLMT